MQINKEISKENLSTNNFSVCFQKTYAKEILANLEKKEERKKKRCIWSIKVP